MEVKVGEYITAQQIKNLQNAINREEKRRNVRIEQSGTYPNQSGISGGHTKRWVTDKLVATGSMTSFTPVEKGDFVKSSDFTAMKNAIKALTGKTMDFNIGSSELDSIDTNTGSIIYAKDMNAMARIVSEMGKYCVCNNKEACNCKEACNSNCSCQGHCTCNSYDPCSCVGYTPPPPCTCRTHTCSCQSYTQPCTCKNDSGCGCKSYSATTRKRVTAFGSLSWEKTNSYLTRTGYMSSRLPSNARNIKVESCKVTYNIFYTTSTSGPTPTDSYVNTISHEASGTAYFGLRNVHVNINGRVYQLKPDSSIEFGMTKSDWSITTISYGQRLYDQATGQYITYNGPPCRQCSKTLTAIQGQTFPYFSTVNYSLATHRFGVRIFMGAFRWMDYFKSSSQYVSNNAQIYLVISYDG